MSESGEIALRLAILVVAIPLVLLCLRPVFGWLHARAIDRELEQVTQAQDQEASCSPEQPTSTSDSFRFSPELFDLRSRVIAKLEDNGFTWLSHYSSVDCLQDVYGLEVCGVHQHSDALAIRRILIRMFPEWNAG